ncbi:hypothetical protein C8R45DRAFT_1134420 [Mycena sanguinolenta]|nr:hypothetical protein C8R45DRAFT_1134420 [Mycena sanguinolenta]
MNKFAAWNEPGKQSTSGCTPIQIFPKPGLQTGTAGRPATSGWSVKKTGSSKSTSCPKRRGTVSLPGTIEPLAFTPGSPCGEYFLFTAGGRYYFHADRRLTVHRMEFGSAEEFMGYLTAEEATPGSRLPDVEVPRQPGTDFSWARVTKDIENQNRTVPSSSPASVWSRFRPGVPAAKDEWRCIRFRLETFEPRRRTDTGGAEGKRGYVYNATALWRSSLLLMLKSQTGEPKIENAGWRANTDMNERYLTTRVHRGAVPTDDLQKREGTRRRPVARATPAPWHRFVDQASSCRWKPWETEIWLMKIDNDNKKAKRCRQRGKYPDFRENAGSEDRLSIKWWIVSQSAFTWSTSSAFMTPPPNPLCRNHRHLFILLSTAVELVDTKTEPRTRQQKLDFPVVSFSRFGLDFSRRSSTSQKPIHPSSRPPVGKAKAKENVKVVDDPGKDKEDERRTISIRCKGS